MTEQPAASPPLLWREEQPDQSPEVRRGLLQRRRVFILLSVMLALAGGVAGLLWWLRPLPHPYFVPLWVTDYSGRPLPPRILAEHDRDAFLAGTYFSHAGPPLPANPPRERLVQELTALRARAPVDTVVVYLSSYAYALSPRDQGADAVSVLPADADPINAQERLPLREALQLLADCPARHKLLILDVMAPLADPRLGVLADDVAAGVLHDLDAVADPGRFVLCACAPGQVSLVSQDMGRTVFGHYVEEGLRGWADGCNSSGTKDGQVSVQELAEYVRNRVQNWAEHNRSTSQTPLLLGSAPDFPLTTLERGQARPHLAENGAPAAYPDWLRDAWKVHDRWRAEEDYRLVPQLHRQLELLLLQSERDWSNGADSKRLEENWKEQLARLELRLKHVRALTRPEPPSLALGVAEGQATDPTLLTACRQMLEKLTPAPAPASGGAGEQGSGGEKTGATAPAGATGGTRSSAFGLVPPALVDKIKGKPHFQVAWAAFEAAVADPDLTPDKVRALNALLQFQEPQPVYVETLFLQRLEALADQYPGGIGWPRNTVHLALSVVHQGEQAASQAEALPWIRGVLDDATQKRHDAETLLWANGYASVDDAEVLFRKAAEGYEACLAHAETIGLVHRRLEDALTFLPPCVSYLEREPRLEPDWLAATRSAGELYDLLGSTPAADRLPKDPGELRRKDEEYRQKIEDLQEHLAELQRPFAADSLTSLAARSRRPNAQATTLLEIEAILATPYLSAADRLPLWQAGRALAARLHAETVQTDQAPDVGQPADPAVLDVQEGGEILRMIVAERERDLRRARLSISLLEMGGLAPAEVQKLRDGMTGAEKESALEPFLRALEPLGVALRQAWNDRVPAELQHGQDLLVRDRLSRIFLPFDLSLLSEDPKTIPQVQLRAAQDQAVWTWRAARNRYDGRDLPARALLADTAARYYALAGRSYAQFASAPAPETFLQLTGTPAVQVPDHPDLVPLTPTSPTAHYLFRVQQFSPTPATNTVSVRVLKPDDEWLQVSAEEPAGTATGPFEVPVTSTADLPLRIDLKPGAVSSATRPPLGVVLEARVGDRTFHLQVPVSLQAVTDRLEILLSADPAKPTDPLGDLLLRPGAGRQPFYVHVRNPTSRLRNVVVQLVGDSGIVSGGEVKVTVPARGTTPVLFSAAAPPPPPPAATPAPAPGAGTPAVATAAPVAEPELPELRGPLTVRLLDADNKNAPVDSRLIRAGLASARQYSQVTSIQFTPPTARERGLGGAKNRLNVGLKALPPLSGAPPRVELVLPPRYIPGLGAIKGGTRRSELPLNGSEVKLYAEDLELAEGTGEEGLVFVSVDGWPRAYVFHTTFARQGDPTTPREELEPALRLDVARYALSSDKFSAGLQVDNAPDGASVDLSLGHFQDSAFEAEVTETRATVRRQHIGFALQAGGALAFDASVSDWSVPFDTSRTVGSRQLRARLFDSSGTAIRTVYEAVTLDNSPPEKVHFVDPPKQVKRDVPLTLKASGDNTVSGIKEVQFFIGKPVENKVPPGTATIAGQPLDTNRTLWSATFTLPKDHKGPLDFSAQFITAAGLSEFATTTVELLDVDPIKLLPGKIEVSVMEGAIAQSDLDVVLRDAKGTEKEKQKTNANGKATFDNVPAGKYSVYARKAATDRHAQQPVTVENGKTATVSLKLYR